MTKQEKQNYVAELTDQLKSAKAAVFTEYHGTSVAQMETLRTKLYEKGIQYKVAKNSLVKRALDDAGLTIDDVSILDRPVALAATTADEVEMAKTLTSIHKEMETIIPLGGIINGSYVTASVIQRLATLPGREELYAKMVGSLAGLPSRMVRTIANPMQGLVTALEQVRAQKEAS